MPLLYDGYCNMEEENGSLLASNLFIFYFLSPREVPVWPKHDLDKENNIVMNKTSTALYIYIYLCLVHGRRWCFLSLFIFTSLGICLRIDIPNTLFWWVHATKSSIFQEGEAENGQIKFVILMYL
jgi:hypothetical protein